MNNAQSDPVDTLLAGFVAGTLPRAVQTLVAAHLELRPDHRGFVSGLDANFTRFAESAPLHALRARDERLARILASEREAPPVVGPAPGVPSALRAYCGRSLDALDWRFVLPGIRECRFPAEDGVEASFIRIKPGRSVPAHTHEGQEITLLLKGGFTDITGHYTCGDLVIADGAVDHKPVADKGEECICFAVTDAPLRLTGPVGRYVSRLFG